MGKKPAGCYIMKSEVKVGNNCSSERQKCDRKSDAKVKVSPSKIDRHDENY